MLMPPGWQARDGRVAGGRRVRAALGDARHHCMSLCMRSASIPRVQSHDPFSGAENQADEDAVEATHNGQGGEMKEPHARPLRDWYDRLGYLGCRVAREGGYDHSFTTRVDVSWAERERRGSLCASRSARDLARSKTWCTRLGGIARRTFFSFTCPLPLPPAEPRSACCAWQQVPSHSPDGEGAHRAPRLGAARSARAGTAGAGRRPAPSSTFTFSVFEGSAPRTLSAPRQSYFQAMSAYLGAI